MVEKPIEITHSEWTILKKDVSSTKDKASSNEKKIDRHEQRLDDVEKDIIRMPQDMQTAVQNGVNPVMASVTELVKENARLSKQITEVRTEKYIAGSKVLVWALAIIGAAVLTFIVKSFL